MLEEVGVRERLERESPGIPPILDHLQTLFPCFGGTGWTVFNDWLEAAWRRAEIHWPNGIPHVSLSNVRTAVFELNKQYNNRFHPVL